MPLLKFQRHSIFYEIHRVLKNEGKIIIYEPKNESSSGWDINKVQTFFDKLGYETNVYQTPTPQKWKQMYILIGKKRK